MREPEVVTVNGRTKCLNRLFVLTDCLQRGRHNSSLRLSLASLRLGFLQQRSRFVQPPGASHRVGRGAQLLEMTQAWYFEDRKKHRDCFVRFALFDEDPRKIDDPELKAGVELKYASAGFHGVVIPPHVVQHLRNRSIYHQRGGLQQRPSRLNTLSIVVIVFQLRVVARSPKSLSIAPR